MFSPHFIFFIRANQVRLFLLLTVLASKKVSKSNYSNLIVTYFQQFFFFMIWKSHSRYKKNARGRFILFKYLIVISDCHLGFFVLIEVFDDFSVFHDNQAITVFQSIFHVVCNHERCQLISRHKFICQIH